MEIALEVWTKSITLSSSGETATPPFGAFLIDKDEITLMVDSKVYSEHCKPKERNENDSSSTELNHTVKDNGINYRLFTFDDVVMDPVLVGFMAVVTKLLAENHISVLPYAAYSTDHIFVADYDADKAKTILETLIK